jgi:hypothetical protein
VPDQPRWAAQEAAGYPGYISVAVGTRKNNNAKPHASHWDPLSERKEDGQIRGMEEGLGVFLEWPSDQPQIA